MATVRDADYSIATNGDIRFTGSGNDYNNTVIEFHRWLGDKMDDALAAGDDLLDITDATASERSTDNIITLKAPYNIDDTLAQHLYDGSIVQNNGDEIYEGILVFAATGMYLSIVQEGAVISGASNFWTTGINADAQNGISHRFMLKVRTGGNDKDGRRIIGQTREFGKTYSEFKINGTSRGNNVLALTYAIDLNNQTAAETVDTWDTITNAEGYRGITVNTLGYYYSEWNKASYTINQFYERMKWLTRRGSAEIIYPAVTGLNGELFRGITHEVNVDGPSGTFNAAEAVSWGSGATAGTGQMLAINSPTAPTKMWIQLLTGVAPSDPGVIVGGASAAQADVNGALTERTLSFPFCGASTGSAIIGSYGFGVEIADLSASDKLTDLGNNLQNPPNNVTFTVSGLVSGEDRVLVAPLGYEFAYDTESGGPFALGDALTFTTPTGTGYLSSLRDDGTTGRMQIRLLSGAVPTNDTAIASGGKSAAVNGVVVASEDPRQLKLATTLVATDETAVVCTAAIPTDTPSTGTIRIQLNTGIFMLVAYTSYTSATFTIAETDFSGDKTATGGAAEIGNSIFISYIDKLITGGATSATFTGVYLEPRLLFIRVRDGGTVNNSPIKTFETTGSLGSAGGSSTAIRTSDL